MSVPSQGATTKKAADFAEVEDWPGYYRVIAGNPPRETLLKAARLFDAEWERAGRRPERPVAIDLGCGEGRDTIELLRRGWEVYASDPERAAMDHLRPRIPPGWGRAKCEVAGFEQAEMPEAELVNASYSLPFCKPEGFEAVWRRIVGAIKPGGRFAGQLFGDRDEWAKIPGRTHHTRAEMFRLIEGFILEDLEEVENDAPMAGGKMKHWHVFHVVGRKR